ncbi:esterase [Rhypophila decipiens]|uniref:Esterase n=1 Tax=Rhypophila decipiens TaxID=261697 RepID=A0AAN6YAW7_9PEZI|nr:esterase [Rhypophila decipiens]
MRLLPLLLAVVGLLAPTPSHSAFIGVTAASLGNKELLKDQPPKENLYQATRSQQQQEQQQVLLPDSIATLPEPGEPDSSINNSDDDDNKPKDPNPLPGWLNKYTPGFVAFGDSYSAGIGTSLPPGTEENSCRQGNGAYPYLIYLDFLAARRHRHDHLDNNKNDTTQVGEGGEPILQWLSCTGSRTDDVLATPGGCPGGDNNTSVSDSQIDLFNFTFPSSSGVKFATLSIGGNDVGFFDVINACVFRFYAFYSGTCEETLLRTEKLKIDQEAQLLVHKIRLILLEILDKVHWERNPDFRVIMTGYARFFNAETEQCDEVSLGVCPKLTRNTRKRMNHLVEGVNLLLHGIAGDVNARFTGTASKKANHIRTKKKVIFVNYDYLFEGHRFCEEGVTEPDFNRTETWFFLPGGGDNLPNKTTTSGGIFSQRQQYERRRQLLFLGTEESHLVDPETCLERITSSKGKESLPPPGGSEQPGATADWGEQALYYMALVKAKNPHLVVEPPLHPLNRGSMWYVPTYYGKTFHPRYLGHQVIRDRIYEVWGENEREGG